MNIALLTAAGNGTRMGQNIPKQFIHIDNKPLIIHTMEAFQRHSSVDAIRVVTLPAWIEVLFAHTLSNLILQSFAGSLRAGKLGRSPSAMVFLNLKSTIRPMILF